MILVAWSRSLAFRSAIFSSASTPVAGRCPSVGCGQDWRFETDDLVGQALVAEDVCVHLCAFPADREGDRNEHEDLRIMPPSYRRRGRRPPEGTVE